MLASILAPEAQKVQLDIGGKKYDLTKDEKGVWTGESLPQDEGFHYYQLNIDGASVPDPGSLYFYGAGRWGSGIEIPASDQDFYALKDVAAWPGKRKYLFLKINQCLEALLCLYTRCVYKPVPKNASRCFTCSMEVLKMKQGGRTGKSKPDS